MALGRSLAVVGMVPGLPGFHGQRWLGSVERLGPVGRLGPGLFSSQDMALRRIWPMVVLSRQDYVQDMFAAEANSASMSVDPGTSGGRSDQVGKWK